MDMEVSVREATAMSICSHEKLANSTGSDTDC